MCCRWLVAVVLLSFCAMASFAVGSACAADVPAGKGGGPDLFKQALDLGIWTLVVFLLLVFILGRFAWKPMLDGLQQRETNIQMALDEAHQAREEAHKVRDQLQAEMNRAHEKVRELLDEARRDAQYTRDDMMSQARTEIQAERDRLRREIEMTRDQALQELWNRTAELATLVSSRAIRRNLSTDDHRRLVDEALVGLGQAGAARGR